MTQPLGTPADPINPQHYQGFSNGAEVIDITENLTGNGAQAVGYIARSTRIDGNNKGAEVEDLEKAIWFIKREIERITVDCEIVKDDTDSLESWEPNATYRFTQEHPNGIRVDSPFGSPEDDAPTAERASRGGVVDE